MKPICTVAAIVLGLGGWTSMAAADPWKDESGKGRWHYEREGGFPGWGYGYAYPRERRTYKEEYRTGNCKVERKWESSGEYKEEVKCKGGDRGGYFGIY